MKTTKPTVSLILGGGSARGLAHIGVIEVLLERGFEIKSISGCSIGALVGGIYATGKLPEYRHWLKGLDKTSVFRLLDFSFQRSGLFKGDRIIEALLKIVGEHNIEDLPIKYTAVATDIDREKEIWFVDGSLFQAIRASIAIPSVFTPHHYRGMQLLDGGLLDPLPIAPSAGDNTDLTIAVNLNAKVRTEQQKAQEEPVTNIEDEDEVDPKWHKRISAIIDRFVPEKIPNALLPAERLSLLELMSQSIEMMQNTIAHSKMASHRPDILIEIPRDLAGVFEFYRSEMLIAYGRKRAEAAIDHYQRNKHH